MKENKYDTIGLYDHNIKSYEKIKETYEGGEQVVGIVHATGTGKTYNAFQLIHDIIQGAIKILNDNKKNVKILYVVNRKSIIEYIIKVFSRNTKIDSKKYLDKIEFRTYHSFCNMDEEELKQVKFDLIILDEFHHIGAPIWGDRIKRILKNNPLAKVFGMTAYTTIYRGTPYERDVTDPNLNELFSNKIVSRYDLVDAIIDGVLPKPIYKTAYVKLMDLAQELETKIESKFYNTKEYNEYQNILKDIKRTIAASPSIENLIRKNIKLNGKYIYFCPPGAEIGKNDIETIMKEAKSWFTKYIKEEDIVFYRTTSEDGEKGKLNRDAFHDDKTLDGKSADGKLRIMFAINQYNEGVHAPNIDGVILGRATSSDIVFYEQIGRALSVRGDYQEKYLEYEHLSIEELKSLASSRDIEISANESKEEITEKLLSPIIIDLTNNYEFIKELETNLKDRIKKIQNSDLRESRIIKIQDHSFNIEVLNKDLFKLLSDIRDRLLPLKWDEWYSLAQAYYNYYGNLNVTHTFVTKNGYERDPLGHRLGRWIYQQKKLHKNGKLSYDQIQKLNKLNMNFEIKIRNTTSYTEGLKLATAYFEHNGNLKVPPKFKTKNGYEYDEEGVNLSNWVTNYKQKLKSTAGKIRLRALFPEDERLLKLELNNEQIVELICLGMIYDFSPKYSKDRIIIQNFLKTLGIDDKKEIEKYRTKSMHEIQAIANYLTSHNLPLAENGLLHEMFSMTGYEMKKKYGVFKSELIHNYIKELNTQTNIKSR